MNEWMNSQGGKIVENNFLIRFSEHLEITDLTWQTLWPLKWKKSQDLELQGCILKEMRVLILHYDLALPGGVHRALHSKSPLSPEKGEHWQEGEQSTSTWIRIITKPFLPRLVLLVPTSYPAGKILFYFSQEPELSEDPAAQPHVEWGCIRHREQVLIRKAEALWSWIKNLFSQSFSLFSGWEGRNLSQRTE